MDKKRIIIGLIFAAVLVPLFITVPSHSLFSLFVLLLFAGLGTWEFYGLLDEGEVRASKKWGTFTGLLFITATWFHMTGKMGDLLLWCILLIVLISNFFRILAYPHPRKGLDGCMGTILGLVYVPVLWSFLVRIYLSGDATQPGWAAFYVILCMKMADSGGYFFGTRFGKHKLSPVISPQKSWEGLFGGIAVCLLINFIWLYVSKGRINSIYSLTLLHAVILGFLLPVVGTLGDLVESMFKRAVKMKDSNTMVYGIGGVLDMIDSILFAAPLFYIYSELFL